MTRLDPTISEAIRSAKSAGLSAETLSRIERALLPDFSYTLGCRILAIFAKKQKDIIRQNPTTGRDAVPFFDVLAALGDPVPSYRCNVCWGHLRNFVDGEASMFEVKGLNYRGYTTPYIDLEAIETLADDVDQYVFAYARKTPMADAVRRFKEVNGCR